MSSFAREYTEDARVFAYARVNTLAATAALAAPSGARTHSTSASSMRFNTQLTSPASSRSSAALSALNASNRDNTSSPSSLIVVAADDVPRTARTTSRTTTSSASSSPPPPPPSGRAMSARGRRGLTRRFVVEPSFQDAPFNVHISANVRHRRERLRARTHAACDTDAVVRAQRAGARIRRIAIHGCARGRIEARRLGRAFVVRRRPRGQGIQAQVRNADVVCHANVQARERGEVFTCGGCALDCGGGHRLAG